VCVFLLDEARVFFFFPVGYYKQNFAGAPKHVSFEQMDAVLRHFQREGHRPLIILHNRHTSHGNFPKQ